MGKLYKILCTKKCEGVCPYYGKKCICNSLYQKISSKIVRISSLDEYFPLNTCEEELKQCLNYAVDARENALFVIKGQTAIGKTEIYCRMIQERKDKKFLIAVPTCELQREVAARLNKMGVECYVTESLIKRVEGIGIKELSDEIRECYESGYGKYARKIVRSFLQKNKDKLNAYQHSRLKEILRGKDECVSTSAGCIITTHAYLMMMDLNLFTDYEIIIDEDFLMTLLKKTGEISLKDIQYAVDHKIFSKRNTYLLNEVLKMKDEETRSMDFSPLSDTQLQALMDEHVKFEGPVPNGR